MAEMQEFSPSKPSKTTVSQSRRMHLALAGLAVAALFVSFWSGVQFQRTRTASSPSVNTASQNGYYQYGSGSNGSSNNYQTQNNSSLEVQTN